MKPMGRTGAARILAISAALAVAVTGLVPGPVTAQVTAPEDCPEAMPTSDVTRGMTGTGFTVSQGTEPEPFDIEVLGVLANGVAPGRDMIVVDTSSPAIDRAGGIWFGMSGSPVYADDGRLLGAVAFGLSGGPSSIGGLTPAEDLFDLLDYPATVQSTAPRTVRVSGTLGARINARSAEDGAGDDATMKRLRAPLSVSGLSGRGYRRLGEAIRKEGNKYLVAQGSSAEAPGSGREFATVGAGDTFAAVMSYGDLTIAGIGTTTLVCDRKSIAFGHPFGWQGKAELGGNAGDTHTIIRDPLFGSYKLADVTDVVGVVDQDRLAGIRGLIGVSPETAELRSTVTAPHLGVTRNTDSSVVSNAIVPSLAFFQLFASIDSTFDEIGGGNSRVAWVIRGTTANGGRWGLTRSNVYAHGRDISIASSAELAQQLNALLRNRFTEIDFTEIDVDARVTDERSGYRIAKLLHSTTGRRFRAGRRAVVRPGGRLVLRVRLAPIGGGPRRNVDIGFKVPRRFRGGFVRIESGGGEEFLCFEDCAAPQKKGGSFGKLINSLKNAPKNNDVKATLAGRRIKAQVRTKRVNRVVRGFGFLNLVAKK